MMKDRNLIYKITLLFISNCFIIGFAGGCQGAAEVPPAENMPILDEENTPAESALGTAALSEEESTAESEAAPVAQRLPDISIDVDLTVMVGSYSTLDGEKWLSIEWDDFEGSWLWLYFGGYADSGDYAGEWAVCLDRNEISRNQIHTPVGKLDTSDSTVTWIDMVYDPGITEHDGEAIYLDDGTVVYTLYRDIDSPRYEDRFDEPEFYPNEYDDLYLSTAPADGTISYFRFTTEVGQYVVQNGNYVLVNAWTWTNNEVAQYGVSGNPISWHTNRALPPVDLEVER